MIKIADKVSHLFLVPCMNDFGFAFITLFLSPVIAMTRFLISRVTGHGKTTVISILILLFQMIQVSLHSNTNVLHMYRDAAQP